MAVNLNDLINIVKREARYGTYSAASAPGLSTDQPTIDILNEINIRLTRIWGKADWKWQREKLAFAVTTTGSQQYSVLAKSGNAIDRILNLIPNDTTASPPVRELPLVEMEYGAFYDLIARAGTSPDFPRKYINIGQDANGNWQVIIWPPPPQNFTMAGFAKAVLKTYTMTDVTANNPILYFPLGIVNDVLLDGVRSGIAAIQGEKDEAKMFDDRFEAKCKLLVKEQIGVGRDNSPYTAAAPMAHGNSISSNRPADDRDWD